MTIQSPKTADTNDEQVMTEERLDEINKYLTEMSYSARLRDSRPEGEVGLTDFNDWMPPIENGYESRELPETPEKMCAVTVVFLTKTRN